MSATLPTSVRLPADADRRLEIAAEKLGVSKSELLRATILAGLEDLEWEAAIRERAQSARSTLHTLPTLHEVAEELDIDLGEVDMSLLDDVG